MKNRKEIPRDLLERRLNNMHKNSKQWDDIAVLSPKKKGKIHGLMIRYYKWKEENK